MFDLRGKTALVTGGTRGIGLAVACRFRDAGANVAICARHPSTDFEAKQLWFIAADLRQDVDVERAFGAATERMGPLDVVVLNAGAAFTDQPQLDLEDPGTLSQALAANTASVFYGLKAAARAARDGGSIIVTSSVAATLPFPGYMCYSSAKAALQPLVQHAAMKLGARAIRVNSISPGTILTAMQPVDDLEARLAPLLNCLGRVGQPNDVIGAFHFLASDESRFVTGIDLRVDGGWLGGLTVAQAETLAAALDARRGNSPSD
jgi:NAD(P)-dependent dehydrogenase (short-subunit alcohol dehydrogenase family)